MEIKRKIKIEFDLDIDINEVDESLWNDASEEEKEIFIKEKTQEFLVEDFDFDYAKVEIIDLSLCNHSHQKWIDDPSTLKQMRICVDCNKIMEKGE
jgi:hypothetical protein